MGAYSRLLNLQVSPPEHFFLTIYICWNLHLVLADSITGRTWIWYFCDLHSRKLTGAKFFHWVCTGRNKDSENENIAQPWKQYFFAPESTLLVDRWCGQKHFTFKRCVFKLIQITVQDTCLNSSHPSPICTTNDIHKPWLPRGHHTIIWSTN